jgi:hypothetical protein
VRLLEDAWPAGEVRSVMRVEDYDPAEDRAVLAGHLGLLPRSPRVVTLLREPAARAWSHYHAVRFPGERPSFAEFLEHPVYRWCAADYQASVLGIPPQPGEARQAAIDAGLPAPPAVVAQRDGVAGRAQRTLDECALTGTTERVDDFVLALGRLLGRRLPPLQRINVRADAAAPPAAEAALVRERSGGDLALHEHAGRLLDAALRALPELRPEPLGALPLQRGMDAPLCGTGWHSRVHTPEAGWHRWTGPGLRSTVRFPVRLAGPARLSLAIVSACDDAAVRSLRIALQGRPLAHALEPRRTGVVAVADAELDPAAPLELAIEVDHVRPLPRDPAGLAIGELELRPRA